MSFMEIQYSPSPGPYRFAGGSNIEAAMTGILMENVPFGPRE